MSGKEKGKGENANDYEVGHGYRHIRQQVFRINSADQALKTSNAVVPSASVRLINVDARELQSRGTCDR